jgi:hypothetical protein
VKFVLRPFASLWSVGKTVVRYRNCRINLVQPSGTWAFSRKEHVNIEVSADGYFNRNDRSKLGGKLSLVSFNRGWSGLGAPSSGLGPVWAMVACCLWVLIGGGLSGHLARAMVACCLRVLIGSGQGWAPVAGSWASVTRHP